MLLLLTLLLQCNRNATAVQPQWSGSRYSTLLPLILLLLFTSLNAFVSLCLLLVQSVTLPLLDKKRQTQLSASGQPRGSLQIKAFFEPVHFQGIPRGVTVGAGSVGRLQVHFCVNCELLCKFDWSRSLCFRPPVNSTNTVMLKTHKACPLLDIELLFSHSTCMLNLLICHLLIAPPPYHCFSKSKTSLLVVETLKMPTRRDWRLDI
jgi:hypothetical protein